MISQLNKKFHKHNKKKNTIIIVMDMVTVMVTDTVMVTATVMVMVTDTVIVMNTVMNTVITITEVEEVDGDNTWKVLPKTKNGNKLPVTGLIWQKSILMVWKMRSKKRLPRRILAGDSEKKDLSGHKLEQLS